MAELTVQTTNIGGLTPSFASANAGGDSFNNDGQTFLYVKNGDASSHDVTLEVQKTIEVGGVSLSITNPSVTVPASDEKIIGPFDREWFNDNDKLVHISYDDVTSVTVAAIKV